MEEERGMRARCVSGGACVVREGRWGGKEKRKGRRLLHRSLRNFEDTEQG